MRGKLSILGCGFLCSVAALVLPAVASADIGHSGPTYPTGTGRYPTTSKPESKLWFHDGTWWASIFNTASDAYEIYRLNTGTQNWVTTGVEIDGRPSSRQDVLSDGNELFVASYKFSEAKAFSQTLEGAINPNADGMVLYRFTYDTSTDQYGLTSNFPVNIDPQRSETLVIDRAQDGKLWATWVQQHGPNGAYRVFYSHTNGDCSSNTQCAWDDRLPVPGSDALAPDDISSLVRFSNRIGIMWSDQTAGDEGMKFVDVDTSATFSSVVITTPIGADRDEQADDHINMKADAAGNIYVATKTKFTSTKVMNPQTRLLVRHAAGGNWTIHTISFSPEQRTRPIVVLDEQHNVIHVYETGPHPSGTSPEPAGGSIFESTSRISSINFAVLSRRPVIRDDDSAGMNNATSTKQSVGVGGGSTSNASSLVVLASDRRTRRYWHHFETLSSSPPVSGGGCTIRGTRGADIITGTRRRDIICGLGGNDIIRGFGGNDRIEGGRGNDRLFGMAGRDVLVGGPGGDVLVGSSGNDRLLGQSGRDRLSGGVGRDALIGGTARDRFAGGRSADTLVSRDRTNEVVNGGPGRDRARVNRGDILRSIARLI